MGANTPMWNVSLVKKNTMIPGEEEFLSVPYSVFEVDSVRYRPEPHSVVFKASHDNSRSPTTSPEHPGLEAVQGWPAGSRRRQGQLNTRGSIAFVGFLAHFMAHCRFEPFVEPREPF